ncbi:MAG: SCO family protein [Bacteroidota bacterium]
MKHTANTRKTIVFIGLILAGVTVVWMTFQSNRKAVTAVKQISPVISDQPKILTNKPHYIADFSLVNQNGDTITRKDLMGKVRMVNFFYTTCNTLTPTMTASLHRFLNRFKGDTNFIIVSHTVDPEHDNVKALHDFGVANNIDPKRWLLLTGDKQQIYDLAKHSYFCFPEHPKYEKRACDQYRRPDACRWNRKITRIY